MKDRKTIAEDILRLIDTEAHRLCVPLQQGHGVQIKHMLVQDNDEGFSVSDSHSNRHIADTFSKIAALAIAKSLAEGITDATAHILKIDAQIQQKYNDCVHFKHTMYHTVDEDRKLSAEIRYDVAWDDVLTLRSELDHYIFD